MRNTSRPYFAVELMQLIVVCFVVSACSPIVTVGDACEHVGESMCERLVSCGEIRVADVGLCRGLVVQSCCVERGTCSAKVKDAVAVERCAQAIESGDCARLREALLPAVCVGVAAP